MQELSMLYGLCVVRGSKGGREKNIFTSTSATENGMQWTSFFTIFIKFTFRNGILLKRAHHFLSYFFDVLRSELLLIYWNEFFLFESNSQSANRCSILYYAFDKILKHPKSQIHIFFISPNLFGLEENFEENKSRLHLRLLCSVILTI